MNPRSTIGPIAGALAATVLALAPGAQARDSAKFKVLCNSVEELAGELKRKQQRR